MYNPQTSTPTAISSNPQTLGAYRQASSTPRQQHPHGFPSPQVNQYQLQDTSFGIGQGDRLIQTGRPQSQGNPIGHLNSHAHSLSIPQTHSHGHSQSTGGFSLSLSRSVPGSAHTRQLSYRLPPTASSSFPTNFAYSTEIPPNTPTTASGPAQPFGGGAFVKIEPGTGINMGGPPSASVTGSMGETSAGQGQEQGQGQMATSRPGSGYGPPSGSAGMGSLAQQQQAPPQQPYQQVQRQHVSQAQQQQQQQHYHPQMAPNRQQGQSQAEQYLGGQAGPGGGTPYGQTPGSASYHDPSIQPHSGYFPRGMPSPPPSRDQASFEGLSGSAGPSSARSDNPSQPPFPLSATPAPYPPSTAQPHHQQHHPGPHPQHHGMAPPHPHQGHPYPLPGQPGSGHGEQFTMVNGVDGQPLPAGTSGGKIFRCMGFTDCDMTFTRSEHLARHVRKHTGERPFPCHCQKSFSRLDNLRQHAATVHSDTPELNERMLRALAPVHAALSQRAGKEQRKRGEILHIPKSVLDRQKSLTRAASAEEAAAAGAAGVAGPGGTAAAKKPRSSKNTRRVGPPSPPVISESYQHTQQLEMQHYQQQQQQHQQQVQQHQQYQTRPSTAQEWQGRAMSQQHRPGMTEPGWDNGRPPTSAGMSLTGSTSAPALGPPRLSQLTPMDRTNSTTSQPGHEYEGGYPPAHDPFPYGIRPGSSNPVHQQLADQARARLPSSGLGNELPADYSLASAIDSSSAPWQANYYDQQPPQSAGLDSGYPSAESDRYGPESATSLSFTQPGSNGGTTDPYYMSGMLSAGGQAPAPYSQYTSNSNASSGPSTGSSRGKLGSARGHSRGASRGGSGMPHQSSVQVQDIYGNGNGNQESPFSYNLPSSAGAQTDSFSVPSFGYNGSAHDQQDFALDPSVQDPSRRRKLTETGQGPQGRTAKVPRLDAMSNGEAQLWANRGGERRSSLAIASLLSGPSDPFSAAGGGGGAGRKVDHQSHPSQQFFDSMPAAASQEGFSFGGGGGGTGGGPGAAGQGQGQEYSFGVEHAQVGNPFGVQVKTEPRLPDMDAKAKALLGQGYDG